MRDRLFRRLMEDEPGASWEPAGCSRGVLFLGLLLAFSAILVALHGPYGYHHIIGFAPEHPAPPHLLYGLLALLLAAASQAGRGAFRRSLPLWSAVLLILILTAWISRYLSKDAEDTLAIMANLVTIVGVTGVVLEVYSWMAEHRRRAAQVRMLQRRISDLERRLAELEISQAGASPRDGSEGSSAPPDTQPAQSDPP